jgi:hypothetical protein
VIGSTSNVSFSASLCSLTESQVTCLVVFRQLYGPQHLEFQYFARHLQYLQQNSDGSFSKIVVFTGPHRGPRPLASILF